MFFETKYGRFVIAFTLLVSGLIFGFFIFSLIYPFESATKTALIGVSLGFCALLLILFLFSPRGYELGEDSLYLVSIIRRQRIPYSDIERIYKVPGRFLLLALRISGCRGFCGFFGSVKMRGQKETYFFTTSSELVALETPQKIYILSPKEREVFIKELKMRKKIRGA